VRTIEGNDKIYNMDDPSRCKIKEANKTTNKGAKRGRE
jgi:hypothetical protein